MSWTEEISDKEGATTMTNQGTGAKGLRIVKLTAENVKRIRAVEIEPDGNMVVISGRNAQGKTSVLDAIWYALGGGPAARGTSRPIRDGEEKASVRLDLADLVVTRTWTGDKTALKVESADGAKYGSPQGVLDALVGRLSFDPLEFTRLSPRDQVAALLDLVDLGVDLDALATERQTAYDDRAEIGRQGKAIGDVLAPIAGVPETEQSAVDIFDELNAAEKVERYRDSLTSQLSLTASALAAREEEIERLKANLKEARAEESEIKAEYKALAPPADIDEIRKRLASVEETNREVRRNAEVRAQAAKKAALHGQYDALTRIIDSLDKSKSAALAKAKFPVDGLGFDDSGVTFEGIPFSQASSAEQIRVSLAMAMSLNPKLRVIRILDGSLLDAENLALIEHMAKTNDYQIWIERVDEIGSVGVVIEDGAVALEPQMVAAES